MAHERMMPSTGSIRWTFQPTQHVLRMVLSVTAWFVANLFTCIMVLSILNGECEALTIWAVDEPPGSYLQNGKITGFSIAVMHELQRRVGDSTPVEVGPEQRVLNEALSKEDVICLSFSRTPEREYAFRWLMPVFRKAWMFYMRRDAAQDSYSFEELRKMHVGVKIGDVREAYLKKSGFKNVESVSNHALNIHKLHKGRLDAILYDTAGMTYDCKSLGIDPGQFKGINAPYSSDVYILFSKRGDLYVFEKWKKAADDMQQDGTYRHIAEEWARRLYDETGMSTDIADNLLIFK